VTDVAANPLVAARHDSTQWHTGLGLVESIADTVAGIESGSWVDGTIGGVATSLDALATVLDPLGSLVSWGVAWLMEHVKPLSDALDWLAGDPDQIAAYAQTWRNVASNTADVAADLEAALAAQIGEWGGASGRAYRERAAEQLRAMDAIGRAAGGVAALVEGAGLLVALVRELVRDLIADFVSVLAVRLPMWLAEAGLTLGAATPLVVSQVGSLVAKWAARIGKLMAALISSLRRLTPMLNRLGSLIDELSALLRRLGRSDGAEPSGTSSAGHGRDTHLQHSEADPLGRWGPARATHRQEWDAAIREARELGVEVVVRPGALAYGPSPSPGAPGQLVLDPDASYGALLHEMQHMRDDRAAGWAGMRGWFEDPSVRYENEVRAYEQEIRYAESISDRDSVEKLRDLIREEYVKIFGEQP
jgi:hypothetical protein